MADWIAVLRAAEAAARWHANQSKEGAAPVPYINHLLEVAALVAEATDGRDLDLVVAALLHDAVEDQDVAKDTIVEAFGTDVAGLVMELTDDTSLPEHERKRSQVEHAPALSQRAKIIKLADKISNLTKVSNPPAAWSVERRLDYLAWAREVVNGLRGVNARLEEAFDEAAAAAEAKVRTDASRQPTDGTA